MSIDFSGLGAENACALMNALIPKPGNTTYRIPELRVYDTVKRIRESEVTVTDGFKARKDFVAKVGNKLAQKLGIHFSGDDGILIPKDREYTAAEKRLIVSELSQNGNPSGFRAVFISKNGLDGKPIDPHQLSPLITERELLEKAVRAALIKKGFFKAMPDIMISVDAIPANSQGGGKINLLIGGEGANYPGLMGAIKIELNNALHKLNSELKPGEPRYDEGLVEAVPIQKSTQYQLMKITLANNMALSADFSALSHKKIPFNLNKVFLNDWSLNVDSI
jgi:hypothetical protein